MEKSCHFPMESRIKTCIGEFYEKLASLQNKKYRKEFVWKTIFVNRKLFKLMFF